jgi:hypothetical protein
VTIVTGTGVWSALITLERSRSRTKFRGVFWFMEQFTNQENAYQRSRRPVSRPIETVNIPEGTIS